MDVTARSGRWGTEAQGTRCREGETGHNAFLEGLPVHLISRLVDLPQNQVEAILKEMDK